MVDTFDFEALLEARLRARAAIASRRFDAVAIAHEAVTTGTRGRWLGRLEWPSRPRGYAWVIVVLLLALALLGGVAVVGALLRVPAPVPSSDVTNGWIALAGNPFDLYEGENGDIYLVPVGTAAPPRLIIGSGGDGIAQQCPSFSPDGHRLAYGEARASGLVSRNPRGPWPVSDRAVVVVGLNANGDASSPIIRVTVPTDPGEIVCPQWSPDGTRVAFRVGSDLWVADDTSGKTTMFPVEAMPWVAQGFAWSRDGSRIAVAEPGEIRVVPIDGRTATVIPVEGATLASIGWTAGDDSIVYVSSTVAQAVYRVDADGSNDTQIAVGSGAIISPDGTRVACTCDSGVLTMDSRGGNVVDVAAPSVFFASAWSPDGKRLLSSTGGGLVSVAVAPGSPLIVYLPPKSAYPPGTFVDGGLDLQWSQVAWQPVFP
jgi:Tol biopolymer transport system component